MSGSMSRAEGMVETGMRIRSFDKSVFQRSGYRIA
jgi:hypothetical protein